MRVLLLILIVSTMAQAQSRDACFDSNVNGKRIPCIDTVKNKDGSSKVIKKYPDGMVETHEYDANGELISFMMGGGRVEQITPDEFGLTHISIGGLDSRQTVDRFVVQWEVYQTFYSISVDVDEYGFDTIYSGRDIAHDKCVGSYKKKFKNRSDAETFYQKLKNKKPSMLQQKEVKNLFLFEILNSDLTLNTEK